MKHLPLAGLLAAVVASTAFANGNGAAGMPSRPLAATTVHGHTNAFVLRNDRIEVVILPSLGRIATLRLIDGENLVRFDGDLASRHIEGSADEWRNFGGDWIWPVSQAHWGRLFGLNWPPQPFIDGLPWTGNAWVGGDGSQSCRVSIDIGAPLHVRLQRTFRIDPGSSVVTIRQRAESTGVSEAPITLWNITQIGGALRVALPVDADSRFTGGVKILDFAPPAADLLTRTVGGVVVLDTARGTEHKLGSDSARGWIAAQKGDVLVVERAETINPGGEFPDGGCRVEVYANSGLGYAEIETLSEERVLNPGESIENVLTISLQQIEPALDHEAFASRIQSLLGEPRSER